MKIMKISLSLMSCLTMSIAAEAAQIDFTGGTVVRNDASVETTTNSVVWDNIDYYTENGFKLDFISGGAGGFESNIGDYYVVGNDVIHGHWATGEYGGLTQIKVTKLDDSTFDLNYFLLTSNTDTGGAPASGFEMAYIHASLDGTTSSYSQLLPPEDWGFPAVQIFLGPQFDGIKAFWFTAENSIDCFGMDEFYFDEPAPPPSGVPEPSSLALLGLGTLGLFIARRRRQKRQA